MLIIYIIVIYRKLLKLIFVNVPLINNNKGSSVNIALKVDEREFPFLEHQRSSIPDLSTTVENHRKYLQQKKSLRGSHFSFVSFLPRLKLEKNSTEYNCVEIRSIIKETMKHDQSVPVSWGGGGEGGQKENLKRFKILL